MAASGSAISARNVYAKEPTPNTREVPDHHIEFVSYQPSGGPVTLPARGHRGGRGVALSGLAGNSPYGFTKTLDLVPESLGEELEHCWGGVATAGAGPYTHTITPSRALTTHTEQFIATDFGGTVRTFEYTGAMCSGGSLAFSAGGDGSPITLTTNEIAHNLSTAQTAVSASFPTVTARWASPIASLTVGGSAVCVNDFTLNWDNGVVQDFEACAASPGLAAIRAVNEQMFTGSFTTDFDDLTLLGLFLNRTESAMVLTIDDGTASLVITMNVLFTGNLGEIPESGALKQPLAFKCQSDTSDAAAFTAVLTNADSAA